MQLSGDLRKNELFEDLFQSIDNRFAQDREISPFHEWVVKSNIILDDGKPFSFARHEYLEEPYQDNHPWQVEIKSTQMGETTKALLRSLYDARFRNMKGLIYYFPSDKDVTIFNFERVIPLIAANPDTIGQWIGDTNNTHIKRVWKSNLHLRGMKGAVSTKSVVADKVFFDELDLSSEESISQALKRLSHSEFKEVLMFSNPTLCDFGIDKLFQETDQRFWLIKCPACGHYTDLVGTFPTELGKEVPCLLETKNGVIRACEKCKAELNPSVGQWVAKHPRVTEKRGRQYSQLFSHFVKPEDILHEYRTTKYPRTFFNLTLGIAWIEAQNRLSIQEVLACCGNEGILDSDPGPCFLGIDQGKDLHVVIGKKHPQKAGKIIHIGVYRDWEELDPLMKNFNVIRCVVDALPETRNARAFAERHKGKVFLSWYRDFLKADEKWNEGDLALVCNRTESLDNSHNEIQLGSIILPRECEIMREFATHCHNAAKRLEEDSETGDRRYTYVKLGQDHFRHALNYESLARRNCPDLIFPELV
jgi:hypothetical protein